MTYLKAVVLVAVAALSAPLTGAAQNAPPPGAREAAQEMVEEGLRRRLVNGCELILSALSWVSDEDQVDRNSRFVGGPLSESAERLVRSRLQVAGLHAGSQGTDWYLFVGLHTVHGAFMVDVRLQVLGVVGRGQTR